METGAAARRFSILTVLCLLLWVTPVIAQTPVSSSESTATRSEIESALKKTPPLIQLIQNFLGRYSSFWRTTPYVEKSLNLMSDIDYLESLQIQQNYGQIATEYDSNFETRFYYSALQGINNQGGLDRTDHASPALVVFFHGTGTSKANGSTFNYKANRLANQGYAVLSFDYPFHQDGPRNTDQLNAKKFYTWVKKIIEAHRGPHQKVVLAGHSGGATIIAELVTRYPDLVDGAVMASPVAFNRELRLWYRNHVIDLLVNLGGVRPNEMGARWAFMMEKQATWTSRFSKDPTLKNPKLHLRVLAGANEEFWPSRDYDFAGAIHKHFANAQVVVEPGVGHKLAGLTDASGQDLISREIENALGIETVNRVKEYGRQRRFTWIERFIQMYRTVPLMKMFAGLILTAEERKELGSNPSEGPSRRALAKFEAFSRARMEIVLDRIRATENSHPEFYAQIREELENSKRTRNFQRVLKIYSDFLAGLPEEERGKQMIEIEDLEARYHAIWSPEEIAQGNHQAEEKPTLTDEDKRAKGDAYKVLAHLRQSTQKALAAMKRLQGLAPGSSTSEETQRLLASARASFQSLQDLKSSSALVLGNAKLLEQEPKIQTEMNEARSVLLAAEQQLALQLERIEPGSDLCKTAFSDHVLP